MASGVQLTRGSPNVFRRFAGVVTSVSDSRPATNVVWNLLGGLWAGVLVVIATPWYVDRLGIEGYGIVGVWLVLQGMMGLLDVGMGVTVIKAFASASADRDGRAYRRDVLRTLESLYWGTALAFALGLFVAADWIGRRWLHSTVLAPHELVSALRVMALALGLQFPVTLYSNGFAGIQEHGRMNALQVVGNTMRYGGGAAVLFWTPHVLPFFIVQATVAAVQTLLTRHGLQGRLSVDGEPSATVRFALLKPLWVYSAGMAVSSFAAVFMSNSDRLVLSAMSTTAELGKYSVAFTASGLLQLAIQPFYRAFFPRYSELVAAGSVDALQREYFRSCQLMAMFIVPIGVVGSVYAPELISVWLGAADATVANVFRWLLIGIMCAGLMWLPAALQQAHGWTGLHSSLLAGALLAGVPLMPWCLKTFGTAGATVVWLLHGTSGLTLGLWLMHRRLLPGRLFAWYRTVLLKPMLASLAITLLSRVFLPESLGRMPMFAWVCATGLLILAFLLPPLLSGRGNPATHSLEDRAE